MNNIHYARPERGDDIFDSINTSLNEAGQDGTVFVNPDRYVNSTGKAVSTRLETTARDQSIHFWGSDIELSDDADTNMVQIKHSGCKLVHGNLLGNVANNSITNAIATDDTGITGLLFHDIEFEDVPVGVDLDTVSNSLLTDTKLEEEGTGVETGIKLNSCNDLQIGNTALKGFSDTGLRMDNCDSIGITALTVQPNTSIETNYGIHMKGCTNCNIVTVIRDDGSLDTGILDEPYDPEGANQQISDKNRINAAVNGVRNIGVHIRDAEAEHIQGNVDGSYSGGRTTQAFLIDHPNNLVENPSHTVDLNGTTLTRITDTQIDSVNAGVQLRGRFAKVQEKSTIQLRGDSKIDVSLGVAVPNPGIETLTDTEVNFRQGGKNNKTNGQGQVSIDWGTKFAFTDKPIITVNLEAADTMWYVESFDTNNNGRYTGATIQVTDLAGSAVGANVAAFPFVQLFGQGVPFLTGAVRRRLGGGGIARSTTDPSAQFI